MVMTMPYLGLLGGGVQSARIVFAMVIIAITSDSVR